jgi:hypothetical protein
MWIYEGEPLDTVPEGMVGFVYLIENTLSGKQYIGKKLFTKAGYKQVKGKRKKLRKDSDWKMYFGSNNTLNSDVLANGEEHFTRVILHLCKTRGWCNYLEMKEQVLRGVLEFPDRFYNDQIRARVHRIHLK